MILGTQKDMKSLWLIGGNTAGWVLIESITGSHSLLPFNIQKEAPTKHSIDVIFMGQLYKKKKLRVDVKEHKENKQQNAPSGLIFTMPLFILPLRNL